MTNKLNYGYLDLRFSLFDLSLTITLHGQPLFKSSFLKFFHDNHTFAPVRKPPSNTIPLFAATLDYIAKNTMFHGTASQFLRALDLSVDHAIKNSHHWPTQPNHFARKLRQLIPTLRAHDIEIISKRDGHGSKRILSIRRRPSLGIDLKGNE